MLDFDRSGTRPTQDPNDHAVASSNASVGNDAAALLTNGGTVSFRRSWTQRLFDRIFGFDFFIAYAWQDGRPFARSLAEQLTARGYDVFLDSKDYYAGQDWKQVGAWALEKTRFLVLVGTRGALASLPVQRELRIFRARGRQIIPIDIDGSLSRLPDDHPVRALLPTEMLQIRGDVATAEGLVSDAAFEATERCFVGERQVQKRLRWIRRVAAALVVLAAVTTATGAYALFKRSAAVRSQRTAERQSRRSQALALAAQSRELSGRNDSRSLLLAVEATKATAVDELVTPAARDALARSLHGFTGIGLVGHRDAVYSIGFSADERRMITTAGGEVRVWDLTDHRRPACTHILQQPAGASAHPALDATGHNAVTLVGRSRAMVWPLIPEQRYPSSRPLWDSPKDSALAESAATHVLAVASAAGKIGIFSLDDLSERRTLRAPPGDQVASLSFSADGNVLLAGTDRSHVWIWDLASTSDIPVADVDANHQARQPNMERVAVDILGISGDHSVLYTASSRWFDNAGWADPDLKVWRLARFQPQGEPMVLPHRLASGSTATQAAALSADSDHLFTTTLDGTVRSWRIDGQPSGDTVEPERVLRLNVHTESSDFCLSSGWLAFASGNQVRLVSSAALAAQRAAPVTSLLGFDGGVRIVRFSPGGHLLAAGGLDGMVRVWTLDHDDPVAYVPSGRASPYAPGLTTVMARNGELAAIVRETSLEFWELHDPFSPHLLRVHPYDGVAAAKNDVCTVCQVILSPDNRWVAVQGRAANSADILELSPGGRSFQVPSRVWSPTGEVEFAGGGRWLLVKEYGGNETLYDLYVRGATLPSRVVIDLPPGSYSRKLAPDGQRVVYKRYVNEYADKTGRDQVVAYLVQLDRANDATRRIALGGFEHGIGSVSFSKDGRIVAIGGESKYGDRASDDTTVKVWRTDQQNGDPLTLSGQEYAADLLMVSPDGRRLMTASRDILLRDARTRARLWRLDASGDVSRPEILPGVNTYIHAAEMSPDGRLLVTISDAGPTARLWRLGDDSVELVARLVIPPPKLNWHWKIVFSPDSARLVIAGTDDPTPYLWTVADLRATSAGTAIANGNQAIQTVEFTPDGKYLMIENAGTTPTGIYGASGAHVTIIDMSRFPDESSTFFALQSTAGNAAVMLREDLGLLLEAGASLRAESIRIDDQLARAREALGRNLTLDEWLQTGITEAYRPTFGEHPLDAETLKRLYMTVIQRSTGTAADQSVAVLVDRVRALDEADVCNSVAWQLAQASRGSAALSAIACAVKYDREDPDYRDTRGVALALVGRTAEAIDDWEYFVNQSKASADAVAKRQSWIREARAGRNPFARGFVGD
jgi:WD40 repeat protein